MTVRREKERHISKAASVVRNPEASFRDEEICESKGQV